MYSVLSSLEAHLGVFNIKAYIVSIYSISLKYEAIRGVTVGVHNIL